jgi:hypothetical protein
MLISAVASSILFRDEPSTVESPPVPRMGPDRMLIVVHHREGPSIAKPFDHWQHVRFAWSALGENPGPPGETIVADEIREFADIAAPGRYHETLTRFWLHLVEHTVEHARCPHDFDELLVEFPVLLDKTAPLRHWSSDALWSSKARADCLEPDLAPLPQPVGGSGPP